VGLRTAAGVLRGLTWLKLALLGLLIVWGFASGAGDWTHFAPFAERRAGSPALGAGLAAGLMSAFFSFGGFWDVSKVGGEVKDPARSLPRALALGVVTLTLVYVLTSAVFLYLVPLEEAASGAAFAAQAGQALFGRAGGQAFAVIVAVALLGSLSAVLMAYPRVYWAMARDGLFFRSVGRLHPRFGTPLRAILLQVVLASLLVTLGTFDQIVAYFIFITVLFVALTAAGLYRLPRPAPGAYRIPGYPVTPAVFLLMMATLLALLGGGRPREALLGTAVVALGWPVYRFLLAPRRRTVAASAMEEA
jgi:APA family basic amino acid/polyamine antiporter